MFICVRDIHAHWYSHSFIHCPKIRSRQDVSYIALFPFPPFNHSHRPFFVVAGVGVADEEDVDFPEPLADSEVEDTSSVIGARRALTWRK